MQIADVVDLVEKVELSDVFLFEERGRRIDETRSDGDAEPRIANVMSAGERHDDDEHGLGFRFRIVFDDREGNEFVSDFQARYVLPGPFEVEEAVRIEFAERVAFFAVYPYLRASIQMTAARMGVPAPVLSMVRAGEFKLGGQMTDEDVEVSFRDRTPEA